MFSPLQGNRTWCAKLHALWLCPWSWCAILRMKFYDSKYYIKINYMISLQKAQWIFLKPKGAWKARCPERCLQRGLLAYYSVDVKTVSGMLGHFVFWARTWVNRYSRPLTRTISHQIAKKSPEILRFQDFVGCGRGTWTPRPPGYEFKFVRFPSFYNVPQSIGITGFFEKCVLHRFIN